MQLVNKIKIQEFLEGRNPEKYIVAIETNYFSNRASLIINDPIEGKKINEEKYKTFLWFKHDIVELLYTGKRMKVIEECEKQRVKIKLLKTQNSEGFVPYRLENGYKYIATCDGSFSQLLSFFKNGGIDPYSDKFKNSFFILTPTEQFMIQTGKRLFKGFEEYNELHRFQFDLETTGLNPKRDRIFQIGMRDNRGFEYVLEVSGNTPQELRDSERYAIKMFFKTLNTLQPDTITGYNSENFDWDFIIKRAEILTIDLNSHAIGLNESPLYRRSSIIKLGNETERYNQTYLWGNNILDISHSVRKAQAINSDIKEWGLKYITKFSKIAKLNRVYLDGNSIFQTWNDKTNDYAFNEENGSWYKITEDKPLKDGYFIVKGNYIVQRYLLDDLWETENVDSIFNQASFLLSKILPTNFMRSSTMGTAGQWKLIMSAWSYENGLAIPQLIPKKSFTGGLSRLLEVGFAKNVMKLDFAALYPKTQLTYKIFPNLDISGVMEGVLTYVVDTRDESKFLMGKYSKLAKQIKDELENDKDNDTLKEKLIEYEKLAASYDRKQLPLKILANSWFGAYGAPYIFPWGDTYSAEETTCRGRQHLRSMVKYFVEKHNFRPLVLDTDGVNFAMPTEIENYQYSVKGTHWKTEKDANKILTGVDAALAEFNETEMFGRMGLDIDDIYNSTINFARKNYANDLDGKIKLVGNTIKSKKMPLYIEEFLDKGIRLLLDNKGYEFIEYYYDYVNKIYNNQIPTVKIASKAKVKKGINEYIEHSKKLNKKGNPLPKQAHMELAINNDLSLNLGDVLFYVNTGIKNSDGDIKSLKDKNTGKIETILNCKLIDYNTLERDLDNIKDINILKKKLSKYNEKQTEYEDVLEEISKLESLLSVTEYNVDKYLSAFNNRIKPLLVCFDTEIRDCILISIKNDRKTKLTYLEDRCYFTHKQCNLIAGKPFKPEHQDTYEELMTMEDKEIVFWTTVNKTPNNIDVDEWDEIKSDYLIRYEQQKNIGIMDEKHTLIQEFKKMELEDFVLLRNEGKIPLQVLAICDIDENYNFISRKWSEKISDIYSMLNYEEMATERNLFYKKHPEYDKDERYVMWLQTKIDNELENIDNSKSNIDSFKHKISNSYINVFESLLSLIDEFEKNVNDNNNEDDEDDVEDNDE